MEQVARLSIVVQAEDQATKILEGIGKSAEAAGAHFGVLGKGVATGVVLGVGSLVAFGGAAIDLAAKYQSSTAMIAAQANISVASAQAISNAFLNTAGHTTMSAQTIATAYSGVAGQLGTTEGKALNSAQAMQVMQAAMDGAEASGSALGSTTTTLASVMQAYQLKTSGASSAMDILYNVSRTTGVGVDAVGQSADRLKTRLGPLAPSLADVGTMMEDLASHGVSGTRGMMMATNGLNTLLNGSKGTSAELQTLGMHIYDSSGKFVGMSSVIQQLSPHLANMTEQQRLAAEKTLFGAGASRALDATLIAGLPAWQTSSGLINAHGTAAKGAATATDTMKGSLEKAKSAVDDFMIRIGNMLMPVITILVNFFTNHIIPTLSIFATYLQSNVGPIVNNLVTIFQKNVMPAMQTLGTILFNFVIPAFVMIAKTVIPPVISVLGFLGSHLDIILPIVAALGLAFAAYEGYMFVAGVIAAISTAYGILTTVMGGASVSMGALTIGADGLAIAEVGVSWPLLAIIAAIVAVVAIGLILITHWKQVTAIAQTVWHDISGFFINLGKDISGVINNVINWFKALPGNIVNGLSGLGRMVGGFFSSEFHNVTNIISGWVTTAVSFFSSLPGKMGQAFQSFGGDLARGFKSVVNAAVIGPIDAALRYIGDLGGSIGPLSFHIRDAFGGHMPQIPQLAAGGKFNAPALIQVGEAGTEWVINRQQAGPFAALLDALLGGGSAALGSAPSASSASRGGMAPPSSSNSQPVLVQLVLDKQILGKVMFDYMGHQSRMQGYSSGGH